MQVPDTHKRNYIRPCRHGPNRFQSESLMSRHNIPIILGRIFGRCPATAIRISNTAKRRNRCLYLLPIVINIDSHTAGRQTPLAFSPSRRRIFPGRPCRRINRSASRRCNNIRILTTVIIRQALSTVFIIIFRAGISVSIALPSAQCKSTGALLLLPLALTGQGAIICPCFPSSVT